MTARVLVVAAVFALTDCSRGCAGKARARSASIENERLGRRPACLLSAVLVAGLVLAGCGEQKAPGPAPAGAGDAEVGRQVYLGYCATCHAADPAQRGPVGPPVKGASRELLEARVVHGTYPPGYTPKQNTAVMQPMPDLARNIPDLAAYLR